MDLKTYNLLTLQLGLLNYYDVFIKNIKNKDFEVMPPNSFLEGYDLELIEVIAVLNYIHETKTPWSCQGNHKNWTGSAYIILEPHNTFPKDLLFLLLKNGFLHEYIDDYDKDLNKTPFLREKISIPDSWINRNFKFLKKEHNQKFLLLLKNWARKEIENNLHKLAPYYAELFKDG